MPYSSKGHKSALYKDLAKMVDAALIRQIIQENEEVSQKCIMKKRDSIIKNHINNVFPIKEASDKGKTIYYTKLTPHIHGHEGKITAKDRDNLIEKIIAYYLEIDYFNRFTVYQILEMAIDELTPETALRHRQLFKKYFSTLSNKKICMLTEKDIRDCLAKMISDGIKAKAFNNACSTLNKINDYCIYNHIDSINIRDKVSEYRKCKMVGKKVFKKEYKRDTDLAFSEKETIEIVNYALEHPDALNLAICTLLLTGLRIGELLALESADIDFKQGYICVEKTENTKTYEIEYRCKDDSDRLVWLSDDSEMILRKAVALRESENSDCPFLFLNHNSDDDKLHLRAVDNRLRKIQHELGFTDYAPERSPHDCRRTYASIQYLHGVDIKTIQAQLGHSNPQQTWDYIKDVTDACTRTEKLKKGNILNT